MEKIYRDADVDLGILKDKTIAVIGYGIQGKVQAANARDSGCTVVVGTRPPEQSASRGQAQADGFAAMSIAEATKKADVLLIELADPAQPALYAADIAPLLARGPDAVLLPWVQRPLWRHPTARRRQHGALRSQRARRFRSGKVQEGRGRLWVRERRA